MSWSSLLSRRAVGALLLALPLAGCGFTPLYGERAGSDVGAQLAQIHIQPIADRDGQMLRNHLLDMLTPKGEPERPAYELTVILRRGEEEMALRQDETGTRSRVTYTAQYSLSQDGKALTGGEAKALTSYDILDARFATIVASRDARERAARLLAEDIRTRLGLYFHRRAEAAGAKP